MARSARLLRRRGTLAAWLAALCALALALLAISLSHDDLQEAALSRTGLHARVIETTTNSRLNAIAESMLGTAEALKANDRPLDEAALRRALRDSLARFAALRSLTVLDHQGRVVISSEADAAGLQVALHRLGTLPGAGRVALGAWLPVRELKDLATGAPPERQQGVIALLHRVQREDAHPLLLVALLNPDYLATQNAVLIGEGSEHSAVLSFEGVMLQRGAKVGAQAGASAKSLVPFQRFLPAKEFGSYQGTGLDGAAALGSFRTLRHWPVVVVVEETAASVAVSLRQRATRVMATLVLVWAAIGLFAFMVQRSITQQEQARAALDRLHAQVAENEQRWKRALDGAGDGVWNWDQASNEIVASQRVLSMLGFEPGELAPAAQAWLSRVHPRDVRSLVVAVLAHLAGRAASLRIEVRVRSKGGSWCWLLIRGHAVARTTTANSARQALLAGTVADVTEQRAAQDALRVSQARRQAILQSSLDAIITLGVDGRVVDFNPAAERMFGLLQASAHRRHINDLLPTYQFHAEGHSTPLGSKFSSYQPVLNRHLEVSARRQDGHEFPVELALIAVQAGDEKLFTATLRDITERKQAETALRESEARARETFEQAAVGVVHGQGGRIVRANQVICDMLQMTREELQSVAQWALLHPDDRAQREAAFQRLSAGEAVGVALEERLRRKDGHYIWLRVTLSLARSSTQTDPYFIAIVEDISARKAVEAERHALQLRDRDTTRELARQRQALDNHALVSITDAQGRLLYVNSKLCEVSGYDEPDLLGRLHAVVAEQPVPASSAWLTENAAEVHKDLRAHLSKAQVWQGELLHRRKNSDLFWAATTVVPMLDDKQQLQHIFVIQTDITRRIAAERAAADARNVELHIGARIQQSLLATVLDQRLPRTWLSACSRPSQGIDGDFLHVITVGPDCVDLVTADVMGKGIGAALIGAAAKMQLSQCMAELMADAVNQGRPEPAAVVASLHKAMVPSLLSLDAFITLSYVRIDSAADTLTWVGCGHEEPLLVRPDGSCDSLANQHPPMGVLEVVDYHQDTVAMTKGDALFACSDGVSDAIHADGSRVGRAAVVAAAQRLLGHCKAPAALVHSLQRELIGPGVRTTDDSSMLVAVRTGDTVNNSRRELPYLLDALKHVRGLVGARCSEAGLDESQTALFTLACVEAFTNIVRHSKGRQADSKIELLVLSEPGQLIVELVYIANRFDLPPIVEPELGDYPEGGFGLSIMRDATDQLDHLRRDGINTIRLVKATSGARV